MEVQEDDDMEVQEEARSGFFFPTLFCF